MKKIMKIIALGSLLIGSSLYAAEVVDINKEANAAANLKKDDLGNKKEVTEAALGLRKTNLYEEAAETTGMKVEYNTAAPGTSQRIARAFQDAPPMIPHSVEGLLPIKTGNNQCLGCHMPEVAPSVKAVAIPKSHFVDFRPKHKLVGQDFTRTTDGDKNEVSIKKLDKLSMSRFNCSQCHAPQSTGALAVSNTFQADFSDKDGASTSTWYDNMNNDLDTVGKDSLITDADRANKNSAAGSLDH
ncbi:nitrate reductase cytochrome c-type subunit [Sulfurovum sp. CS9]|uniref:nitrate reductase cytochrome c-type subunit n=1 Tax=Sulfurovum sp. CS9 TaxID=3391146 RepID=UPI0039E9879E